MKKVILLLLLLVLAITGIFAQSNTTVTDLRKELHAYIDVIPEQNLLSLKPLLAILAEPTSDKSELHEILDAIPPRNIDAVKALLLALTDPSYSAAAEISQPQAKPTEPVITAVTTTSTPAATGASTPVKANEPAKTGKFSVGGGAFFDWSLKNAVGFAGIKTIGSDLMSVGAYGFLDTKNLELSIGPSYGMWTLDLAGLKPKINLLQLDINFLVKFPISLPNGEFIIFPMLGISCNQPIYKISSDGTVAGFYDLGQLGVLGGAGLDINLTRSVYLRAEGLFHLWLPYWAVMMDIIKAPGDTKINLGMGPRIKLGVGYRL